MEIQTITVSVLILGDRSPSSSSEDDENNKYNVHECLLYENEILRNNGLTQHKNMIKSVGTSSVQGWAWA